MSRRSSRLISGGYYNSDEDSDSSTVTNISYRESSVKVFKKKGGNRKSNTPNTSSSTTQGGTLQSARTRTSTSGSERHGGVSPSLSNRGTESTMSSTAYVSAPPTPRPAITTSSRGPMPPRCLPELLQRSDVNCRSKFTERAQITADSSGYSSSEGTCATSHTSLRNSDRASGTACSTSVFNNSLHTLTDWVCDASAAVCSNVLRLAALANAPVSSRTKRVCLSMLLLLLLLLLLLSCRCLLPFSSSTSSHIPATADNAAPAAASAPPAPPVAPPSNTISSPPVLDAARISAAVDEKMERLLVDIQRKQELLLAEMKQELQLELQHVRAELQGSVADTRQVLQRHVSALGDQISAHRTESQSAASGLSLRIQTLEEENAMLSQELSSIKLTPDSSSSPVLHHFSPELQDILEKWFNARVQEHDATRWRSCSDCGRPVADKMADFALESQGASVISTRCSETYRVRSACVTLFGFPLWYPSESPRTVIQGHAALLPGKCWAFHGVQGTLLISLSHAVRITHVTLDHLPRYNAPTGQIRSAPRDFEVYGLTNESDAGTHLGTFTYDEDGEPTQTFQLKSPSDVLRLVELRVLTNWGQVEYTCLYRFRVHGQVAST